MDNSAWITEESTHYVFHAAKGSIAMDEIAHIIEIQETCFHIIAATFGNEPTLRIQYHLYPTRVDVGMAYGDNEPANGFNRLPDEVHAVYNAEIKCIGFHEDAHLISYHLFGRPKTMFVREGLAMHFDAFWHGISNQVWAEYFYRKNPSLKITDWMRNETFVSEDMNMTYPVSGAFCSYLINVYGINKFIEMFKCITKDMEAILRVIYKSSASNIEEDFRNYLLCLRISGVHDKMILERIGINS